MNISLDRKSKIPLFVQIAEQLRNMIVTSQLNAETLLPSIRQMAEYLRVNRQTIHNAIRILEEENLVEIRRGAGIFIKSDVNQANNFDEALLSIAQTAVSQTQKAGYTHHDLVKAVSFIGVNSQYALPRQDNRYLVFIECNWPVLDSYKTDIESELNIKVIPYLLEKLKNDYAEIKQVIAGASLVVTTFSHLHEVRKLVKDKNANVIGIFAGPYNDVMLTIASWPKETKVAVIMLSSPGAAEVRQSILDSGIEFKEIKCLGMEEPGLKRHIAGAEKLIVSSAAYPFIQQDFSPEQQVVVYKNKLDRASLNMLNNLLQL